MDTIWHITDGEWLAIGLVAIVIVAAIIVAAHDIYHEWKD